MAKVTIFMFTRHQKGLRLFAACFDKFWQNICCYIFSVPLYILVFSSLCSILLFNRLLTILRSLHFISRFPWKLETQIFLVWRFSIMLPASLYFHYFTFLPDILSQKLDPMVYKSFSGVENIIPYPVHTDVAVGCPLLRLMYSKITI